MKALAIGTSVLDILVQPVESIPPGQGAALVENIHITPAGTAGGTALNFKKLGFDTYVSSAIGNDLRGRLLVQLLNERGINTDAFQVIEGTPTTGSVIPIRKTDPAPPSTLSVRSSASTPKWRRGTSSSKQTWCTMVRLNSREERPSQRCCGLLKTVAPGLPLTCLPVAPNWLSPG